jgi:apolipoprotein N-acyltransferase
MPAAERPGGGKNMRNILALLAAVLLVGAGLGYYLGWYRVQATPSSDGHQHISIDVDQKKVAADIKHGVQEGTQKVENILKQEGVTVPPTTPRVQIAPGAIPSPQSSYRVKTDGSWEYTGQVSYPQPVTK